MRLGILQEFQRPVDAAGFGFGNGIVNILHDDGKLRLVTSDTHCLRLERFLTEAPQMHRVEN